jgi:heme exporter protein C
METATNLDARSLASIRRWATVLLALGGIGVLITFWMIFFYAPTEREMGIMQRIYYIHVPTAWVGELSIGLLALCSLGYLGLRDDRLDSVAVSAAELSLVFLTATLAAGPLWARMAWGAWWVWDPRLSLTLILWFINLGYFMLRGATESPEQGKRFAAILGIVAAIDLPLIHMSVYWFRSQHPKPVVMKPEGPTADPEIVQTLLVSLLSFTLVYFGLLLLRYGLERLARRTEALRYRAARAAAPTSQGVHS